jgi:hypothetical protein
MFKDRLKSEMQSRQLALKVIVLCILGMAKKISWLLCENASRKLCVTLGEQQL